MPHWNARSIPDTVLGVARPDTVFRNVPVGSRLAATILSLGLWSLSRRSLVAFVADRLPPWGLFKEVRDLWLVSNEHLPRDAALPSRRRFENSALEGQLLAAVQTVHTSRAGRFRNDGAVPVHETVRRWYGADRSDAERYPIDAVYRCGIAGGWFETVSVERVESPLKILKIKRVKTTHRVKAGLQPLIDEESTALAEDLRASVGEQAQLWQLLLKTVQDAVETRQYQDPG